MNFTTGLVSSKQALVELFAAAFTASEGQTEGTLVGDLVRELLTETPAQDIRVFCAELAGSAIGAAIFTRLTYPEDPHVVFLLSPMAVASASQGQGIGQALIAHALEMLRSEGIQIAITYGDPAFYGRVGFRPIREDQARPPLPLRLPHGWLGKSLIQAEMPDLHGPSICVSALNRSDVW